MNKALFVSSKKLCAIAAVAAGAWLSTSCADTYDGGETFDSGVRNTQMVSPSEGDITITPNTAGNQMTITWPVVYGASGYEVALYDMSDETTPLLSRTVDGCSLTTGREEDMNYKLVIRTLGDASKNNTDATTSTEKVFSTFEASYAVIPEGDIYAFFEENPIPEDAPEGNLNFDLIPGGEYTLSGLVDFGKHQVTLRTVSKTDNATITYGEQGSLATSSGFKLKYLTLECSASAQPVLALSATPNPDILDAANQNHYQITDPISIQYCTILNVVRNLMYDNKVKYCVKDFTIDNTLVKFTPEDKMSTQAYFQLYDGGGFINDFTATNCTFYSANDNKVNYFIRYANAGRCDRAGYLSNSINLVNCTFYNIAKTGQMCNHSGFDGRATSNYEVRNNIFVDCGSNQVPRRIVGRQNASSQNSWGYNTYWYNGAPEEEGFTKNEYDLSNNALQTDPAFVDAANGNFRPTGAEQVERKTGDHLWWTVN